MCLRHRNRLGFWLAAALIGGSLLRGAEPELDPAQLASVPPAEPAQALSTFVVRPGVRLELVAAEPLVADPIALCFDENARLFVVEMRDYSERREERLGRIRLLEDLDEDGRMDRSTVFAEDLPWPTGLFWFQGGLFVASTPDLLYLRDLNGDGRADERRTVFTGFGAGVERLNVQQLFNSLCWSLDNRVQGAAGGNGGKISRPGPDASGSERSLDLGSSDFSFDPRTLEMRRESGGGQFGMSLDNFGRKFVCANSAHIRQVMYEYGAVQPDMSYPLPPAALDIAVDGPSAAVFRVSPDEPWRVLRTRWRVAGLVPGPVEGGGRPSGYFTSASGITIYRGTALGEAYQGDAFIADVGSNLVHRKKLRAEGVRFAAERAPDEQAAEFLASRDLWFRPVAFANAPDGALYLADMYREVVEHPWSIPPNLKRHLDLNRGHDRGRIYRVVAEGFRQPRLPRLAKASTGELAALLGHPNGWHRDTAARLLFERQDRSARPILASQWRANLSSLAQVHTLYALEGLGALTADQLEAAVQSRGDEVREHALRLLARHTELVSPRLEELLAKLAGGASARVRYQLAWLAGALPSGELSNRLLRSLASVPPDSPDSWETHAIRAAASRARLAPGAEPQRAAVTFPLTATWTNSPAGAGGGAPMAAGVWAAGPGRFASSLTLPGQASAGRKIFLERCASCHRLAGEGSAVGPDLESVRAAGKELILMNILDPNREVPVRFETHRIFTRDGEEHPGILVQEAPNGLTLRLANGIDSFFPNSTIARTERATSSLMPEGLETGLEPQDLADLLAYIAP